MRQDDDDTDQQISYDQSEDLGASTLSSDIEEGDLVNRQEVLHPDQARPDKTIHPTRVPMPKKRSRADTFIPHTPLPNLRHSVGAIAPPLLKRQKSAINISCESDVVQALVLSKAGGDQNVPQLKAGGDHNIQQHQMATFDAAKQFMEAIILTKIPWPIISDEKYSMVDKVWKLGLDAQDCQRALAGAPVGAPSVCQLPSGPSLEIDPLT